ncbi:MAG: hypothetical protein Q9187_009713, partial [Circinaria calcarea]
MNSLHLFALKQRLQNVPCLVAGGVIPLTTLLTNPSIRGVGNAITRLTQPTSYSPIVPLQTKGSKAPLWLVHPASGDVLVFIALSKQILDRPVYGLRSRGFNAGESFFSSMNEMAHTYVRHITQKQPHGPYAIAGYSLGSSIAFEIAKLLEESGEEVKFLGLLDSPPHIRRLIKDIQSTDVVLNVAYFLELISEDEAVLTGRSKDDLLDHIIAQASPARLLELDMDREKLSAIADMTGAFGEAGKKYEPEGVVTYADVFWVTPLRAVASSRQEWMDEHLRLWKDFVRAPIGWHECEGMHAMMLNRDF